MALDSRRPIASGLDHLVRVFTNHWFHTCLFPFILTGHTSLFPSVAGLLASPCFHYFCDASVPGRPGQQGGPVQTGISSQREVRGRRSLATCPTLCSQQHGHQTLPVPRGGATIHADASTHSAESDQFSACWGWDGLTGILFPPPTGCLWAVARGFNGALTSRSNARPSFTSPLTSLAVEGC